MNIDSFETKKSNSLSHLVIKVGRLLNVRGLDEARKSFNLDRLSQTHLDLYPYIDFKGNTINEIAQRKGVSKQAISKLVAEMEEMGLLEVRPNSKDSRSKIIKFRTKGPYAISKGFKVLEKIDSDLKQQIGEKKFKRLIRDLNQIMDLLDEI